MQGTTKKIAAESIRARWLACAVALVATLTLSLGSSNTPLAATEAQAKTFKPGLAASLAAAYVLGTKARGRNGSTSPDSATWEIPHN